MTETRFALLYIWFSSLAMADGAVTEFCLDGELDLGARYQGTSPQSGEFYPTSWCVISEDDSSRVMFSGNGKSNPDMDGNWTVAYLPPDTVRIVNRDAPPDVEFQGIDNALEALRVRRVDPRRFVEEFATSPERLTGLAVNIQNDRLLSVETSAELPEQEAAAIWLATPGASVIEVPGDRWPARMDMRLVNLADGVYLVTGVRTGFQHLVVDTGDGLVVADAPAGWVEFHHLPPSDLVPGLGVSGLSQKLVEFLGEEFPGRPIHAVALTHFHDDHAGGARAFAAAGADIYATAESVPFIEFALNRPSMPTDKLTRLNGTARVLPVADAKLIGGDENPVKLVSMGSGPHVRDMLGVRVVNSHSTQVTPVSRLAKYLESDLCDT